MGQESYKQWCICVDWEPSWAQTTFLLFKLISVLKDLTELERILEGVHF